MRLRLLIATWGACFAAVMLLFAVSAAGVYGAEDAAATSGDPAPATEQASAGGAVQAAPHAAVKKKRIKQRKRIRSNAGEKLTVDDVQEIMKGSKNLSGKDLRHLNLAGLNLQDADLSGSDLAGANLEGANLQESNLERADFTGTNLKRASLRLADITGAVLDGVKLDGAIWPDGSVCASGSTGGCRNVYFGR